MSQDERFSFLKMWGKRNPDVKTTNINDFLFPGDGGRAGYPSTITAFAMNDKVGCAAIVISNCEVVIYGSQGGTISLVMNDVTINKIVFVDDTSVFVLCRDGTARKLTIIDNELSRTGCAKLKLPSNAAVNWKVTHVYRTASSATLFAAQEGEVYTIDRDTMEVAVFVNKADWIATINILSSPKFEITCITSFENTIFIFGPHGKIALYQNNTLMTTLVAYTTELQTIVDLVWFEELGYAYAIDSQSKLSKWFYCCINITFDEMPADENPDLPPFPTEKVGQLAVLPNIGNHYDIIAYDSGVSELSSVDYKTIEIRSVCKNATFQVTGDIIAIQSIRHLDPDERKNGIFMIVTTTEIIGIDMSDENWRVMRPLYFYNVNNSAPTCHFKALDIDEEAWKKLIQAGNKYWRELHYSTREWPFFFTNGKRETNKDMASYRQVQLTGHASGNICIWACGGLHMYCIAIIRTTSEFLGYTNPNTGIVTYDWDGKKQSSLVNNPVRIIGDYDPMDDEKSFTITNVFFDKKTGAIIASNDGGFIMMYEIYNQPLKSFRDVVPLKISINNPSVGPTNTIVPRNVPFCYLFGYTPTEKKDSNDPMIFQLCPNVKITTICYCAKYNCIVVGTDCGFFFLDAKHQTLVKRVDLHVEEGANTASPSSSRGRLSLKESLRRTFHRRKSSTRSRRWRKSFSKKKAGRNDASTSSPQQQPEPHHEESYGERQIEAKTDLPFVGPNWVVSFIKFLRFPLHNKSAIDDVFVVGTTGGKILFYKIYEDKVVERITYGITKVHEIKLTPQQQIVNVELSGEEGIFMSSITRLVIHTEEQIRILALPGFTKVAKYSITRVEGLKILRAVLAKVKSSKDPSVEEVLGFVLLNNGSVRLHSLHHLDMSATTSFISSNDFIAQKSCVLAADGVATCLKKGSEFRRLIIQQNQSSWSNETS